MTADKPPGGNSDTSGLWFLVDQSLDRHAMLVGRVAMRWAELHAHLGQLFTTIVSPSNVEIGEAAWNSLKVDRAQRDMLEAVAKVTLRNSPVLEEIQWALGQILPLEDSRNTAIHAPYIVSPGRKMATVMPWTKSGNQRAAKLAGRDLDLELKSYASRIEALSGFVLSLFLHMIDQQRFALPPRPKLPRPAQPMIRNVPRRKVMINDIRPRLDHLGSKVLSRAGLSHLRYLESVVLLRYIIISAEESANVTQSCQRWTYSP